MRRQWASRQAMPIAVAVALSLAAALSLAEEHELLSDGPPTAPAKQPTAASDLSAKPAVGSRALTGSDGDDAAGRRPERARDAPQ